MGQKKKSPRPSPWSVCGRARKFEKTDSGTPWQKCGMKDKDSRKWKDLQLIKGRWM